MRKLFLTALFVMLLGGYAHAQSVTVPLAWDASASPGVTYRVYQSASSTMSSPTIYNVTGLQLDVSLTSGQHFFQVTAVGTCVSGDNGQTLPCESAPATVFQNLTATVLRLTVQIPPGNPANAKVRVN